MASKASSDPYTIRFIMQCCNDQETEKLPIIFIKQQWSNEELKLVESTIQESLSVRKQLWHDEIKKLSALQGRKAQEERVKKLNHWINNTSVQYYCLSSSESDFESQVLKILRGTFVGVTKSRLEKPNYFSWIIFSGSRIT
ncbi:hypothetical protein WUBG_12821 [Wuchereria bancrofti]|uniref:Uncharacterized protein n=1 Tax=Wuchereria bancrofti TaxID=6293 RepID=J9APL0_WUCBA|nr:hypothetical protein WUBG_12821 [Wuchereria bancrofti]